MVIFSDVLNKQFNTEAECLAAEKKYFDEQTKAEQLKAAKAKKAEEIERKEISEIYKALAEATKAMNVAHDLVDKFLDKHESLEIEFENENDFEKISPEVLEMIGLSKINEEEEKIDAFIKGLLEAIREK